MGAQQKFVSTEARDSRLICVCVFQVTYVTLRNTGATPRLMCLHVCVCVCVYVRVWGGDGGQAFKGIAAALHRSLEHMNPAQVRELVESQ